MKKTVITLISDLHLGDGGPLEDFLLWGADPKGPENRARSCAAIETHFRNFLSARLSVAESPHLILLGDTFDLWQARRHGETNARALRRILAAHPGFVEALRNWVASGGKLTILAGNHDHTLLDPTVWQLLVQTLGSLNPGTNGAPSLCFSDPDTGVYAEHGNQWDPFNRFRNPTNPAATCVGYRIVRMIVNNLEPQFPLIDKGMGVEDLVEQLWSVAGSELAGHLGRLIGRGSGVARVLHRDLQRILQGEANTPDFAHVGACRRRFSERALRVALSPVPGGTIGDPPQNWSILVSGHTHRAGATIRDVAGRRIQHLDCGTWRPTLECGRRVVQRYPYVEVCASPSTGITATVGEWPLPPGFGDGLRSV